MNRAHKTPAKKAVKKASKKVQPVKKVQKRAMKTTAKPLQTSLFTPLRRKLSSSPNNGPNNIKFPHNLTYEDFENYNNSLPSTTLTEQWDEQLNRLDADIEADEASLSTDVEEHIQEHGDTLVTHQQPAQVQFNIFTEDPQFEVSKRLIGPPGTVEEPTMVFSPKPYRIVGCVGTLEDPHQLGWFSMEGYLKHMCPQCGQVFQLTNNPDECDFSYVEKVDNMKHFVGH
jgi:hypothetical protein